MSIGVSKRRDRAALDRADRLGAAARQRRRRYQRRHLVSAMITQLDAFKATVDDANLLERATLDCIQAMMRRVTVGRSIAEAIIELDRLRQLFEGKSHARPTTPHHPTSTAKRLKTPSARRGSIRAGARKSWQRPMRAPPSCARPSMTRPSAAGAANHRGDRIGPRPGRTTSGSSSTSNSARRCAPSP